ncbi:MAG TPA: aldo/keto reductase [Pseudonocardia sp.]|jgi:aryl-alcohol dehydrogenase-like predicted oxidoreductase
MPVNPAAEIGLGLAALGRPAYINAGRPADLGGHRSIDDLRRRTEEVLDAGYRMGVRYLDVARSYGRAEEFLAGWLAARPDVDDVLIGSKWGYRYVGDWRMDAPVHEVKDHSLAAFTEQYPLTRRWLGDRLGIYHVHSATLDTGVLADPAVHRALAELRDRGIRVGISTSGPAQADAVRTALRVRVGGSPLFSSFEVTWNVLEPSAGPALAEAASSGALVIVKEAVANGRLAPAGPAPGGLGPGGPAPGGPAPGGPAPGGPDDTPGARRAAELAAELSIPVDQLAIAAALAQPWAWRVLSGAVSVGQLTSNVAAARVALPAGLLDELATLAEPPADYWAARSRRPWV